MWQGKHRNGDFGDLGSLSRRLPVPAAAAKEREALQHMALPCASAVLTAIAPPRPSPPPWPIRALPPQPLRPSLGPSELAVVPIPLAILPVVLIFLMKIWRTEFCVWT